MIHETAQEIAADLQALEQQAALEVEAHFIERVRALDVLTIRMLERIENVQYVYGYHDTLARLYHRAGRLWQHLEAVNTRLFSRLRQELAAASTPAPLLRQMYTTYVGDAASQPTALDLDYLDVFFNGVLGLDEPPEETRTLLPEMIAYYPTPARVILALIQRAALREDDVFYDLGSGLGRVAMLVALLTPARVKGVEFEPVYCAYAQQRADSLRLSRVSFLNTDARQAEYTDGTCFFLYTPFTGRLLQTVLLQLKTEALARPLTIVTYGACSRDVAQQPWLRLTQQQTFTHDTLAIFVSGLHATR